MFYIFSSITVSLRNSNSSEKNVILEEELYYVDIDNIGNLEDSPRLVFINGECENLRIVNKNLLKTFAKKSQRLYNSL